MCKLGAGFYMLFVTCISLSCKKLISNIICKIHVFNLYKQNVLILQSGTIKLFGKKKKKNSHCSIKLHFLNKPILLESYKKILQNNTCRICPLYTN